MKKQAGKMRCSFVQSFYATLLNIKRENQNTEELKEKVGNNMLIGLITDDWLRAS